MEVFINQFFTLFKYGGFRLFQTKIQLFLVRGEMELHREYYPYL